MFGFGLRNSRCMLAAWKQRHNNSSSEIVSSASGTSFPITEILPLSFITSPLTNWVFLLCVNLQMIRSLK